MKIVLYSILSVALLSGCSQDKENGQNSSTAVSNSTDQGNTVQTEDVKEGLAHLPEFEVLSNNIDLNMYSGVVETDNPGNRIILFENELGEKVYKSILVKKDNLLKIIKLDDDGLIYKDFLK